MGISSGGRDVFGRSPQNQVEGKQAAAAVPAVSYRARAGHAQTSSMIHGWPRWDPGRPAPPHIVPLDEGCEASEPLCCLCPCLVVTCVPVSSSRPEHPLCSCTLHHELFAENGRPHGNPEGSLGRPLGPSHGRWHSLRGRCWANGPCRKWLWECLLWLLSPLFLSASHHHHPSPRPSSNLFTNTSDTPRPAPCG